MSNRPLKNLKREQFAQLVASGMSCEDAHAKLGYARNKANARRMRYEKPVSARIEAIQAASAERVVKANSKAMEAIAYTRDDAMKEAEEVLKQARELGQLGSAIQAVKLRAQLKGHLIERKEIGGPGDFEAMTPDEIRAEIDAILSGQSREASEGIAAAAETGEMPDPSRLH